MQNEWPSFHLYREWKKRKLNYEWDTSSQTWCTTRFDTKHDSHQINYRHINHGWNVRAIYILSMRTAAASSTFSSISLSMFLSAVLFIFIVWISILRVQYTNRTNLSSSQKHMKHSKTSDALAFIFAVDFYSSPNINDQHCVWVCVFVEKSTVWRC